MEFCYIYIYDNLFYVMVDVVYAAVERLVEPSLKPTGGMYNHTSEKKTGRRGRQGGVNSANMYSLCPTLGVPVECAAGFKKCKRKMMKKDSGMWVLLFYISFIINCDWKKVSGMRGLIPFMEYSNRDY